MIDGDVETGSLMAGQSVGMVKAEKPVAEIISGLICEAVDALTARGTGIRLMDTPRVTGHREALRRLRLVMAGSGSAEERLAEIVRIIAAEMSAEVCSIYVLRVGDILELFATQGLDPTRYM